MKYIRTNGGIIESSRVKSLENGQVELTDGKYSWRLDRFPILKQADTIEELCDEFVWENRLLGKGNVDFESKTTYVSKGGFIPFSDWEYEIYGAIWTDKGLIYVAKMNEKGVLELL